MRNANVEKHKSLKGWYDQYYISDKESCVKSNGEERSQGEGGGAGRASLSREGGGNKKISGAEITT